MNYEGRRVVGIRHFPDGAYWIPTGRPTLTGFRPNPAEWESWGKTTKATLFVGLKTGRRTSLFHAKGIKIPERMVYSLVFGVRTDQVGVQYGSSFIRQMGHYIPPGARSPGQEHRRREPSMQIVVFPAPGESWSAFRRNIREVAEAYIEDLAQQSVIVEFVRDGRVEEIGQYRWVSARR